MISWLRRRIRRQPYQFIVGDAWGDGGGSLTFSGEYMGLCRRARAQVADIGSSVSSCLDRDAPRCNREEEAAQGKEP
eukprot:668978-Amphidinium_carterae.3